MAFLVSKVKFLSETKKVKVGGISISLLKEKYIPQEVFSLNEFNELAKNEELNPSKTVFEDNQKTYFYNDKSVFYYFFKPEEVKP